MSKAKTTEMEITHETRNGERFVRTFTINDKDKNILKNGNVLYDSTNDSLKYYNYNTGTKVSLASAIVQNRKVESTKKITYKDGNKFNLAFENLSWN